MVCFQTPKVALPLGNVFGVTAATPDNPDSFELFKFVVTSGAQAAAPPPQFSEQQQQQQQQIPMETRSESHNQINLGPLDDMYSRIQQIGQELSQIAQRSDERHQELLNSISTSSGPSGSSSDSGSSSPQLNARLDSIAERLLHVENLLSDLQRDNAGKDYRNQFTQLHKAIENSHVTLTEALHTSLFNSTPLSLSPFPLLSLYTILYYIARLTTSDTRSDNRHNPTHGPLHLRRPRVPARFGSGVYNLQASTEQYAEKVFVN